MPRRLSLLFAATLLLASYGEATAEPPGWMLPEGDEEASKGEDESEGEAIPERPVDLFPRHLFGRARFSLPKQGEDEEGKGVPIGDGDWEVHAAQVGIMVGGFALLSALCQGGGCKLPGALSGWVPDALKTEPLSKPAPPPPVEYRQAR